MTYKQGQGVFCNKQMNNILSKDKKMSYIHELILSISIRNKIHKFVKHTVDCNEYVVKKGYSYNEKLFKDFTGYECFCNELYFNNKLLLNNKKPTIEMVLYWLKKELSAKYNKKFCIIVAVDDGEFENITVFFHTYRQNEFYVGDLAGYEQPVLYSIVDT